MKNSIQLVATKSKFWGLKRVLLLFFALVIIYGLLVGGVFWYTNVLSKDDSQSRLSMMEYAKLQKIQAQQAADQKEIDKIINESNRLKSENKWKESLKALDDALHRFPKSDKLYTYKGGWFFDQGNWTMAEKYYRLAQDCNPNEVMYPMNIALCLVKQKRDSEAIPFYERAYQLKPDTSRLMALSNLMWKFNNWTNYNQLVDRVTSSIRKEISEGRSTSINSYTALHLPFTLRELKAIAASSSRRIGNNARRKGNPSFHFPSPHSFDKPIRVGYVSYDFRQHAVGVQIKSMFAMHNRSIVEVFAYNVNNGKKDRMTSSANDKIRKGVDHYVDISELPSVVECAQRIFDDKIDILLDLGLFTAYSRMDIFALKPAPIQVAWLGLATTTGAPWMDYIICDPTVTPLESAPHYAEKLAMLPHSYHIFDHKQSYPIAARGNRERGKMPKDKVLLCNHANNQRLSPVLFDHWVNILKKAPNTTLVLKKFNVQSSENVKRYAKSKGLLVSDDINKSQLLFMPSFGGGEHIVMKSLCDIYLDAHYYNGHSTSGDMLWAGVPLITFPGESMASRAAASFTRSTGVPEGVAADWPAYESLAVHWATHPSELSLIRQRVEAARENGPLFDTKRFVSNLERSFQIMFRRYSRGEKPENFLTPDIIQNPNWNPWE